MGKNTEIKLIQTIYDRIFDIVTYSPGGDKAPVFDTKTTFLQVVPLGQAVNPKDIANAVTPTNPNGSLLASENFARLIDLIPAVQADYATTTVQSDKIYGQIVNTANATEKPDPEAMKTWQQAYDYLNKTTTIKDFRDNETTQVEDTPIYAAYKKNQTNYLTAVGACRSAYNNYDLTDPKQQREWQANEPALQANLNNAWDTWRSQGATQVEQALSAMDHSINSAVLSILEGDQKIYSNSQLAGQTVGGAPWHLSYGQPTNWYDPSVSGFAQFNVSTQNLKTTADSKFTSYGGGTSFSFGLWSVGGSFNHTKGATNYHMDATNLQISMEIGVVRLFRPWMDGSVYSMGGWNMGDAYKKGRISTGNLKTAASEKAVMPLLPTAFIVARNISISGDWSSEDKSHIESATSGSASVGWGPFQIGGNYSTSSSKDTFVSNFQDGSIKIPGLQIIAWVSEIVPQCPPE